MGYYTSYGMHVEDTEISGEKISDASIRSIEEEVDKMNVFEGGCFSDGWFAYAKWYDADEDMTLLSTKFPNAIFYLEGDGENADDHWAHYFHDGKVMYGGIEIVYNPFDVSKLVPPLAEVKKTYSYQEDV